MINDSTSPDFNPDLPHSFYPLRGIISVSLRTKNHPLHGGSWKVETNPADPKKIMPDAKEPVAV